MIRQFSDFVFYFDTLKHIIHKCKILIYMENNISDSQDNDEILITPFTELSKDDPLGRSLEHDEDKEKESVSSDDEEETKKLHFPNIVSRSYTTPTKLRRSANSNRSILIPPFAGTVTEKKNPLPSVPVVRRRIRPAKPVLQKTSTLHPKIMLENRSAPPVDTTPIICNGLEINKKDIVDIESDGLVSCGRDDDLREHVLEERPNEHVLDEHSKEYATNTSPLDSPGTTNNDRIHNPAGDIPFTLSSAQPIVGTNSAHNEEKLPPRLSQDAFSGDNTEGMISNVTDNSETISPGEHSNMESTAGSARATSRDQDFLVVTESNEDKKNLGELLQTAPATNENAQFITPICPLPNVPNYSLLSEQEQAHHRANFRARLGILRHTWPSFNIPDFDESVALETIHVQYDTFVNQIHISREVDQYKVYLVVMFLGIEAFCKKMEFGIQGFAESQMKAMNKYERLLVELGETNYKTTSITAAGVQNNPWPVEIRIIYMAVVNAAVFVIIKFLSGYMGNEQATSLIEGVTKFMSGESQPAPKINDAASVYGPSAVPEVAANPLGDVSSMLPMLAGMASKFMNGAGNNTPSVPQPKQPINNNNQQPSNPQQFRPVYDD